MNRCFPALNRPAVAKIGSTPSCIIAFHVRQKNRLVVARPLNFVTPNLANSGWQIAHHG
jgi:hypothetical protein